jgi:hypothetical protein
MRPTRGSKRNEGGRFSHTYSGHVAASAAMPARRRLCQVGSDLMSGVGCADLRARSVDRRDRERHEVRSLLKTTRRVSRASTGEGDTRRRWPTLAVPRRRRVRPESFARRRVATASALRSCARARCRISHRARNDSWCSRADTRDLRDRAGSHRSTRYTRDRWPLAPRPHSFPRAAVRAAAPIPADPSAKRTLPPTKSGEGLAASPTVLQASDSERATVAARRQRGRSLTRFTGSACRRCRSERRD